jgi:hypothetical protein
MESSKKWNSPFKEIQEYQLNDLFDIMTGCSGGQTVGPWCQSYS